MARIGINALYMIPGGVGGTEIYLRELLRSLARVDSEHEYFVFTNLETGPDFVPRPPNFHWKPQAVHARNRPLRLLWEQLVLPFEISRFKIDVLLNPGFTAPVFAGCRCVTVFHDLQHKRHPEYFRWFDLPFWRFFLFASAHVSARLIAITNATRDDLLHYYNLPPDRVTVVYHGVDLRLFELKRLTPGGFVLCVSTLHPHKNLIRLIRVFGRRKRDYRLVIAGMRGFQSAKIEEVVKQMGLEESVQVTGWISRPKLFELYDRALACIQPSTFEGFGMPVLEAMAAGVPLACSNIPPHVEVAGGSALMFDPDDEDAMEDALSRITQDEMLRSNLAAAAKERARIFTWEETARKTLDVLLDRDRSKPVQA